MPDGELSRMLVLRNETSYIALARVNVHSDMAQLECGPDEAFFAIGNVSGGIPAKQA